MLLWMSLKHYYGELSCPIKSAGGELQHHFAQEVYGLIRVIIYVLLKHRSGLEVMLLWRLSWNSLRLKRFIA
eukprot:snap_masked-scaffold_34-processed-gene-3.43-mRNA-1 protein AED:1.00 eAED:1.00 QI:0/0/0/0/1/1/2/0/71